jgi:nucleoside-diphosphate-sugar epimerase
MSIFIVGCGYLGERVASKISLAGIETHALTRQPERAESFERRGWQPHLGDWLQPETLRDLPQVDTLLIAVTHRAVEGIPAEQTHTLGLGHLIEKLPGPLPRIVYISTTGVYSQDDGAWVNEESPCQPSRPGGIAALGAEKWLFQQLGPEQVTILRMAGLYGPDRIPNAERTRLKALANPQGDSYLNLIHIEDAAGYCVEALQKKHPQFCYLVADGTPIARSEYYRFLLEFLEISPDEAVSASPMALPPRRAESNKRIDVARLRRDFAYSCRYTDFREGIRASCRKP